jgi:hypothetical protein
MKGGYMNVLLERFVDIPSLSRFAVAAGGATDSAQNSKEYLKLSGVYSSTCGPIAIIDKTGKVSLIDLGTVLTAKFNAIEIASGQLAMVDDETEVKRHTF